MGYDRLVRSELGGSSRRENLENQSNVATSTTKPRKSVAVKILLITAAVLIVTAAVSIGVLVGVRGRASGKGLAAKPSQAMARTCSRTLYPSLCLDSLIDFPGANSATDVDLVHISVNMTLQRVGKALYSVTDINNLQMSSLVKSAYDDCLELLEDSIDQLDRSLGSILLGTGAEDVVTWLSAALTNQDTCSEGFSDSNGHVKDQIVENLKDLSELVSNCLAIFAAENGGDFSEVPIQNRRRLLDHYHSVLDSEQDEFPKWLSESDRRLLGSSSSGSPIRADIIVAKDGSGTVKSIAEAIKKVPEHSSRRIMIYIKAGVYEEDNLKIGKKKTNVMIIGDGKGKTVITGGKSVAQQYTTFHTASFAATGTGFIAKGITFQNTAGPSKHQAVALRVGADHAVVYGCEIIGYQDTLYVHSNRQFYRECDIYGTVDSIFGNAAVVIQKSNIYSRKPMPNQKNTITAQNRKDPNQNTGISIHACNILAASGLGGSGTPTFLGRPWKMYSRTVYMMSFMGGHIDPRGWLEWSGDFALKTLYYGEYMNTGPGAGLARRVKWPGYRVIKLASEANKFTVSQFIAGPAWLPSTGVAFTAGLGR